MEIVTSVSTQMEDEMGSARWNMEMGTLIEALGEMENITVKVVTSKGRSSLICCVLSFCQSHKLLSLDGPMAMSIKAIGKTEWPWDMENLNMDRALDKGNAIQEPSIEE